MSLSTPADSADLDAAAIADAATRLAMLQRLADLGMRLAEEICERAMNSPYYPEPRHEPGRAFANISRAVRLTLVLQEKTETRLIALRKGETPPAEPPARVERQAEAALDETRADPPETPDRSRETLRERESERFDELLDDPFDDCVAAIRADLGLAVGETVPFNDEVVESAIQKVLKSAFVAPAAQRLPGHAASTALVRVLTPHPPDSG